MKTDFRAALLAHSTLTARLGQVGSRAAIDFAIRPDSGSLPALTLEMISDPREYNQGGVSGFFQERIQIDIWGESYKDTDEIHIILRDYLEGFTGLTGSTYFSRVFQDSARDLPVTDLQGGGRVFHRATDFIIHYTRS